MIQSTIEQMTFDKMLVFVVVSLLFVQAYVSVMGAVKVWRDEKKRRNEPTSSLEQRVSAHDKMLASDKVRIERLEGATSVHDREMKLVLRSQLALLSHELNGNSIDGLKACRKQIEEFLVESSGVSTDQP